MKLRELREVRGMTQREAAEALQVRKPSADMLPALADLYGVSVDAIYGREPPGAEEKNAG